ncbi:unnamed protein product, partial [Phaedon cochleariae]
MGDVAVERTTEQLVHQYFSLGFEHKEILNYLKILHNRCISLRTLKRILAKLHLYRRKHFSNIEDVVRFMEGEIEKGSQLHGYRWFHLKCLQNDLVVSQSIVRELLWYLDPHGMELRKRKRLRRRQYSNKGPNYLWHMDSYDKLKPYGICINGCIDGFSRQIIWLQAGPSSSDSKVIGGYYMNALKMIKGCPKTLRSDFGTENTLVERMQKALHQTFNEATSERPPFLYGSSTHNQRIEAWWSILRKHNAQFWINLFEMLRDDNLYDGTFLDKSLVQFCFMQLVQRDLDEVVLEWSVHKIRPSRNSNSPSGRPCIMFEMPSLYQTRSYLIEVPSFALDALSLDCLFQEYPCDE